MKVLKIISGSLVLAGIVALGLCFVFIPEQTKAAMDVTNTWLNTPFPIAGVSTITVGYVLLRIFSMTSFGQKQINNIKKQFAVVCDDAKNIKNDLIDYKNAIDVKVEEIEKKSEDKITIIYKEFDNFTNNIFSALENIPNKKVQDYITEYKSKFEDIKKSVELQVTDVNEYAKELKNQYESKYEELLAKVEELLNEKRIDNKAEEE